MSKILKTNESKNAKQDRRVSRQKDAVDGSEEVARGSSEPDEMHGNLADDEDNEFQEDNDVENDHNEKDKERKHQSDNDKDDDYNEKGEDKQQGDNDTDDDYDEKDEDRVVSNVDEEGDDDIIDFTSSDPEEDESRKRRRNHRDAKSKAAVGVRRSQRFVEPSKGLAETKKRLKQRLTRNSAQMISDSEDSCSQENEKPTEIVSDSEKEDSAASGDGSQEAFADGSQDSHDGSNK